MIAKFIACIVCIYGGFWLAAFISELSLRGESADTQGRLLKGMAPLRLVHLLGVPAAVLLGFYVSNYALVLIAAYFALATVLVWLRLRQLQFPQRLRTLQITSTAAVFLGVSLGMVAAYLL